MGNVVQVLVNSDGKSDTGKDRTGNGGDKVTGIDRVINYVNDIRGYIIQESNDYNVDDIIDTISYRVLDSNGNMISVYNNLDNDESTGKTIKVKDGRTLSGIENSDYRVLDPRGYVTEYKKDNDGDGIFDYHNYDIRDPNGNLVATYFDTDADSSTGNTVQDINGRTINGVEKIDYITRNGSGYTTKIETDIGADGSINKTVYEERNNNGYLLGSYSDLDQNVNTGSSYPLNDGRQLVGIDSVITYDVDTNGFRTKESYDYNADGTPDRIDYFVKSPQGYTVERYFDFDGSSSTGLTYTVNGKDISGIDRFSSYTLNELGLIVTAVIDNRGVISRNYDVYNNKRQLIELYQDNDNNPTTGGTFTASDGRTLNGISRVEYREYSDTGEHIFTKVDSDGDGKINSTTRYILTDSDAIGFVEITNPYIDETDKRITSIDFHNTTSHHEDFTTSDWATRLETVGGRLNRIHFLYDNTVDSLTIDSKTIANFVNETTKRLNITGNEHKTVHFTDFTEANQLSETRYQFNFDGNTYTVNVDEAVNVVLG